MNDDLVIAQRNNVYTWAEIKEKGIDLYKGLRGWLDDHADDLISRMHPNSGFFGEWIGMGKIGYGDTLSHKFYMFAKANIDENFDVRNILWNRDVLIYPFVDTTIPDFISVVPKVYVFETLPSVGGIG